MYLVIEEDLIDIEGLIHSLVQLEIQENVVQMENEEEEIDLLHMLRMLYMMMIPLLNWKKRDDN